MSGSAITRPSIFTFFAYIGTRFQYTTTRLCIYSSQGSDKSSLQNNVSWLPATNTFFACSVLALTSICPLLKSIIKIELNLPHHTTNIVFLSRPVNPFVSKLNHKSPRGTYDRYSPRDAPRPRHRLAMLTIACNADKPMDIGNYILSV